MGTITAHEGGIPGPVNAKKEDIIVKKKELYVYTQQIVTETTKPQTQTTTSVEGEF